MTKIADEGSRAPTFLRQWRKYSKLSQEALAERLEISHTTVGRIEKGELPYNQDYLERVAAACGCEPQDLLSTDPMKPDPPRLIYNRLRAVSPEVQRQAFQVLEALLKAS